MPKWIPLKSGIGLRTIDYQYLKLEGVQFIWFVKLDPHVVLTRHHLYKRSCLHDWFEMGRNEISIFHSSVLLKESALLTSVRFRPGQSLFMSCLFNQRAKYLGPIQPMHLATGSKGAHYLYVCWAGWAINRAFKEGFTHSQPQPI